MDVLTFNIFNLARNEEYYHLQCPYTGWNSGWQVDKNIGNWVEDNTITLSCYQGDEDITTHGPTSSTSASPTSPSSTTTTVTTPTTASTTTPEPSVCKTVRYKLLKKLSL